MLKKPFLFINRTTVSIHNIYHGIQLKERLHLIRQNGNIPKNRRSPHANLQGNADNLLQILKKHDYRTGLLALILRLISIAERQRTPFGRVYAYCVVSYLIFHLSINIGMVIGLCPVIGIPLPFFSYGGSSLWGFTILLFILLRIDASRKERRD